MTAEDVEFLNASLRPFQPLLDGFITPSSRTLTRYMDTWPMSLASHFPVIHLPTFQAQQCIPELILAMAALGALQTAEEHASKKLYKAARAVALERFKAGGQLSGVSITGQLWQGQALTVRNRRQLF